MTRNKARQIAEETLQILKDGYYINSKGKKIDVRYKEESIYHGDYNFYYTPRETYKNKYNFRCFRLTC